MEYTHYDPNETSAIMERYAAYSEEKNKDVWFKNPLSINIMKKKYLHPEETTAVEFINRVCSIFTNDELKMKMRSLLIQGSFFPGGRTLYAAGCKGKFEATTSNCFTAGTKVLTTTGIKNIEDVVIGDMVITSQGPHRVNNTMSRRYTGDLYKLSSKRFFQDIICTPNHRFLTPNGWVRADRFFSLKDNHSSMKIKKVQYNFKKSYPPLDLCFYYDNKENRRLVLTESGQIVQETKIKNNGAWSTYGSYPVNRYLQMTDEFMYFIGRWLGDGSITQKKNNNNMAPSIFQIVFNATTEKIAADKCIEIGTKIFGFHPSVRYTEQNVIAVRWDNPIIGSFFYKEFGAGCEGKHINPIFLGDLNMALGLLDSDGCVTSHGALSITLKNPMLIQWLYITLAMNGITSYIGSANYGTAYTLRISSAEARKYLLPRMTRTYFDQRMNINYGTDAADWVVVENVNVIENVDTIVYNLSVDDVHEYNVNGVITHNCFISPNPTDSLDSIYESNRQIAKIFKAGGGIGINLSNLRPNGARTNNAARTSTGAVSFMHIYNATGSVIGFHGRRGATLIGLNISHPDIEEFVELRSKAEMQAMNISCIIDDEFMNAVKEGKQYRLHFHVDATGEDIERYIDARKLYHRICEMNWDYGDPGMLFKNAVDKHNLMAYNKDFKIDICNPCAEYTGPEYNSCNLGSMNLYNYVSYKFSKDAKFSYYSFERDVATAVEALDQILDYGYDLQPLDENRETIDKWRSIGLGFFGYADALVALGIKYGSDEAKEFAANVCSVMTRSALNMSSILGKAYGSFGKFDFESLLKSPVIHEIYNSKIEYLDTMDLELSFEKFKKNKALRNAQLISIAPTGSLSLLAGQLSSGIEPIYKCMYERSTHGLEKSGIHFTVADKAVSDLLKYHKIDPNSITTEELKKRFPFVVEADDIDPMDRVETQAAMQRYIDNAISSTVNLPESATVEDIEKIYMKAWQCGLKGITVFRNNCKRASILGFSDKKKEEKEEKKPDNTKIKMDSVEPISRKSKGPLSGRTYRRQTACVKSLYITVNRDEDGNIFEVFTNKSIHGCSANIATITRLTSLALRSGISVKHIIQELKENACQSCQDLIKKGNHEISRSCPYAIGDVLETEYFYDLNKENDKSDTGDTKGVEGYKVSKKCLMNLHESSKENQSALKCPECGERTLLVEGKCTTCKSCGYSKCD